MKRTCAFVGRTKEGKRSWWIGRASNPVGGATRRRVGSTPIPLRHCIPTQFLEQPMLVNTGLSLPHPHRAQTPC